MRLTEFRIVKMVSDYSMTATMMQSKLRGYGKDIGYVYIANICERMHKAGLLSRHPLGHFVFWRATDVGKVECESFLRTLGAATGSSSINLNSTLKRFV